jgi:hypothetical protein
MKGRLFGGFLVMVIVAVTGLLPMSAAQAQTVLPKQFTLTITELICVDDQQGEVAADEPYVLFGAIKPSSGFIPFALVQSRSAFFDQVDTGDRRTIGKVLINNEALADNGAAEDAIGVFVQTVERDRTLSGSLDKVVAPAQSRAQEAFQDAIFDGITSVSQLTSTTGTALNAGVVAGGQDDTIGAARQTVFTSSQINGLAVNGELSRTLRGSGNGAIYEVVVVLKRTQ